MTIRQFSRSAALLTICLLLLAVQSNAGTVTVGTTAVLTNTETGIGNYLAATRSSLAQAGTLQSLTIYAATASGQVRLGLYADTNGSPGALVASTNAFTPVAGWNTQTVTPAVLVSGNYWLAVAIANNGFAMRTDWSSGTARWMVRTFGALPATWPSGGSSGAVSISFYGTVATGDVPPPQLPAAPKINPVQFTGSIELEWDYAPGGGTPTEYILEATAPPSTTWATIATVPYVGNTSRWAMSSMTLGTKYCFRVYAKNIAGSSPPSKQICATMAAGTGLVCEPSTCRSEQ